ncbi:MAG: flagellar assembly protein FliH [Gammaproteobacteria bacterium]|nr:MAG: flagellar assembly protein FliH [Gammaproteobacteria bacterium]
MSDEHKVIKPDATTHVRRWRFGSVSGEVANADKPTVDTTVDVAQRELLKRVSAEEIEKLRAQAEEAGRQEGYQAGFAEGLAKGEQEVRALIERWQAYIDHLAAPLAEIDEALETALLELVVAVSKQIVRRELRTSPEQILGLLRESIALLPATSGEIRIQVHPEDAQIIKKQFGENLPSQWVLVESPSISVGGCVIETATSRVDATIEARIAEIASRLLGGTRHEDA